MTGRKVIFQLSAALIAVFSSSQVFAINELFLGRGPLAHLKKEDIAIARAEIMKTLDKGADGQTQTWSNPTTKASGTIKPVKTFTKDGMRCRSAEFTTSAGGERGASTWNVCHTKDGWKIAQ